MEEEKGHGNAPQKLETRDFKRRSMKSLQHSQKQLIFDSRYGWIFDEWRDPAQVALVGGRGMFCIVPLAKATMNLAFQWANFAADSVIQVLESPYRPPLPQLWFNTAKQRVEHEFQNWCHGLKSFRRKSCLPDSSHHEAANKSSMKSNLQSGLQQKQLQTDTERET